MKRSKQALYGETYCKQKQPGILVKHKVTLTKILARNSGSPAMQYVYSKSLLSQPD